MITWAIWYFDLKDRKFYPAMAKFYWTLAIIFIPFWIGAIIYWVSGRHEHSLKGELFDFKSGLPLDKRE